MNIQQALLPHKHVRFSESTIAVAGFLRALLDEPRTIEELETLLHGPRWPRRPSFTEIVFAADILYAIKEIRLLPDGRLERRHKIVDKATKVTSTHEAT
jgi:hypothetical protein